MDTTVNSGAAVTTPEANGEGKPLSVSEQLQTLSLYLYLDARRYGTAQ